MKMFPSYYHTRYRIFYILKRKSHHQSKFDMWKIYLKKKKIEKYKKVKHVIKTWKFENKTNNQPFTTQSGKAIFYEFFFASPIFLEFKFKLTQVI